MKVRLVKSIKLLMTAVLIMTAALAFTGCGKGDSKNEDEITEEAVEDSKEEEELPDISQLGFDGIWHLSADTPAGDPYLFQLTIEDDGFVSLEGFSMAGDGWFLNTCYDGSAEIIKVRKNGSAKVTINISELDENGTETDSRSCVYQMFLSKENEEELNLEYSSGDYLIGEDEDSILVFTLAEEAVNPGDAVIGGYENDEDLSEDLIKAIEEAITVFPIGDSYNVYTDEVDYLEYSGSSVIERWKILEEDENYAGIAFEEGRDPKEKSDYARVNTDELEGAISGFFNTDIKLTREEGYDYVVDDEYVTLWGDDYRVAYEEVIIDYKMFKHHMEGDFLYIDALRETVDYYTKREEAMQFVFEPNYESFYGYSLIGFDVKNFEHEAYYSYEEIKECESFIRDYVNNEAEDYNKVTVKSGVDGSPYTRLFVYDEYGGLMFAYYSKATDGSVDNRYYFMNGVMIEWIEGNGNDDANRNRYYSCDDILDSRWKSREKEILKQAKQYREENND